VLASILPATPEIQNRSVANRPSTRPYPTAHLLPLQRLPDPSVVTVSLLFDANEALRLAREISTQNRRAHIAMSFNPIIT
jgi:hypothetical protein